MLSPKMPAINDSEGPKVPTGIPPVVDTHVPIFPRTIFSAIWKWFDENAWPIRYRMTTSQIFDFLLSRGVQHVIALQYAHKPGIARQLNQYMAAKCEAYSPSITGMATVFPAVRTRPKIFYSKPSIPAWEGSSYMRMCSALI